MKRTTFRTASTGTARRLGAGILVMGLALSASAKDGSPSGTAPPPVVKAKPSAKHRFQVGVASWSCRDPYSRAHGNGLHWSAHEPGCG